MAKTEQINAIRVGVVHKLTQRGTTAGLTREAGQAKRLYDDAFIIFDQAHDDFRVAFHGFKKDVFELP